MQHEGFIRCSFERISSVSTNPTEPLGKKMFDRIVQFLHRHRLESQTRVELSQLSDRDLADLGIARSDIRRLARESAAQGVVDVYQWRERDLAAPAERLGRLETA
jgi:uncharacterized protein YjiS (DUF1127 family)